MPTPITATYLSTGPARDTVTCQLEGGRANPKTVGLVLMGEVRTGERWVQELGRTVAGRK